MQQMGDGIVYTLLSVCFSLLCFVFNLFIYLFIYKKGNQINQYPPCFAQAQCRHDKEATI